MHELGIAQNLLDAILATARREGASRVHTITVQVGELTGVVPEALEFAFASLRDGTPAREALLKIVPVPARFACNQCEEPFPQASTACPRCGNHETHLTQGRELQVVEVELE